MHSLFRDVRSGDSFPIDLALGIPGTRESKCEIDYAYELEQEAHGPQVAHLSDIATADMQMLCNIFPILLLQLMKRSSFKQFLILKKNIYGMTVNGA